MTLDEAKQAFKAAGAIIIELGPDTPSLASVGPSWLVQVAERQLYVLDRVAIPFLNLDAINWLVYAAKEAAAELEYNAKLEASEECPGCGIRFILDTNEIVQEAKGM